jgi:hypothetical protein
MDLLRLQRLPWRFVPGHSDFQVEAQASGACNKNCEWTRKELGKRRRLPEMSSWSREPSVRGGSCDVEIGKFGKSERA